MVRAMVALPLKTLLAQSRRHLSAGPVALIFIEDEVEIGSTLPEQEIGRPVRVVATGGLAIRFDDATDIFDHVDADLTSQGLAILATKAGG